MKNLYLFFLLAFFFNSSLFPQTGSVELREGGGTLVNTYSSITEAYNAVPAPLTTSYVIEILTAYTGSAETFPITLGFKSGTDSVKTITIRPAAGNSGEVLSTNSSNNSTLIFDGCEYVILDGRPGGTGNNVDLSVENLSTTGTSTYAIHLRNGASYNTVKYVWIKGYTQDTAGPRALYFGTSVSNPNGNSYNVIEYNQISGSRSCIGSSGTSGSPNTANIIQFNIIEDFGYAGIWLIGNTSSTVILGNIFQQKFGYNTTLAQGILVASSGGSGHTQIAANKIIDVQMASTSSTASVKGIVATIPAGAELSIVDNFVALTRDNNNAGTVYGIQIQGSADFTANIVYNSVYIGGLHNSGSTGAITTAGFVKTSTGSGAVFNLVNNIFVNKRTGGNAAAYHVGGSISNPAGVLTIGYNVYYASGAANSYNAAWSGAVYNDIDQYKTAASPHEDSTIFKNVHFVSDTDLHLADSSVGDYDLAAFPIPEVPLDIDGQLRSLTTPYRGADEADIQIPVELVSLSAQVSGNSVVLKWSTATETNNYGFEIERYSQLSGWLKTGFVPGSNNSTELKEYSFTDAGLKAGTYNYRIKQVDFNGSYKYYNIAGGIKITPPADYELSQNYPNPFNPATLISYSIPEAGYVSLKIYDLLGREIAVLVNSNMEPGIYSVSFDASDFSSGMYIYELKVNDFTAAKKMMLSK